MKVFISHSSDDKRFVRTLKTDLNENGIHTWVDEDELNFGDSLMEKLEVSIDDTSHFIIILSESSINSPWVKKELQRVLKQINKRIIPIKYKECRVPDELDKMLFGDVSSITRTVVGDHLSFKGDSYFDFINRLLKALRAPSTKLTPSDKRLLVQMDESVDTIVDSTRHISLHLAGFSNTLVREEYVRKITEILSQTRLKQLKQSVNRPIILPQLFNKIYPKIQKGTEITIRNKSGEEKKGVFAGFRKEDDQIIVLPISIRNYLGLLKDDELYDVVVSIDKLAVYRNLCK